MVKTILKKNPAYGALVFETFMKLGKLQCKSNFNKNYVLLLMIENFESNQIVLYFTRGYMMHLESTCHVSNVMCHMSCVLCLVSYVSFQPFQNRKS